ncbi:PorT family protein [Flavihumibacter sp. R14]|nr:PorT family protein [Flavihumibacter soli]
MIRISTFLVLCLLTSFNLSAQEKARFGLKTGFNVAWQSREQKRFIARPAISMHFTGFTEVQLSDKIFMQPGLSLQGKGYNHDGNRSTRGAKHMLYMEIPVNFLYKFKLPFGDMIAGGGPYAGIGLWDKEKVGSESPFSDIWGSTGYKNKDYGLNLSLGTQLNSRFILTLQQGIGLANVAPETYIVPGPADGPEVVDGKMRNMVSSVSLGYRF